MAIAHDSLADFNNASLPAAHLQAEPKILQRGRPHLCRAYRQLSTHVALFNGKQDALLEGGEDSIVSFGEIIFESNSAWSRWFSFHPFLVLSLK